MKRKKVKNYHWNNFFNIVESAKGYSNFTEWSQNNYQATQCLISFGWKDKFITQCFPNEWMRKQKKWTFKKFVWVINKYKIISIKDWIIKDKSSCNYFYKAIKRKTLSKNEISNIRKIFKSKIKRWTFDECFRIAKSFKTKIEWRKKSNLSYKSALHNGWYKECTTHMPNISKANFKLSEVFVDHPYFYKLIKKNLKYPFQIYYFNKQNVKDLSIKIDYKINRPDFIIYNHNNLNFLFIEIKKDSTKQTNESIKKQLKRYNSAGIKNGGKFKGTILFTKKGQLKKSCRFEQFYIIKRKLQKT